MDGEKSISMKTTPPRQETRRRRPMPSEREKERGQEMIFIERIFVFIDAFIETTCRHEEGRGKHEDYLWEESRRH
jgi:hypothetical protein